MYEKFRPSYIVHGENLMAIIPTLSTSILFCNLHYIYTIVNFTTECGENRHTDIANFATLIHTKKMNTVCSDFYHTIW